MFWNNLTSEEKNITILKLILKMANADLSVQEEELGYLKYFCKAANLDPQLIDKYSSSDSHQGVLLPLDEQNRMNILYHLLFVINADADVSGDEERAMFKIAFRLGFNENITRDFIELMKLYPLNQLPNDAMLGVLRKYNN